MPVYDLLSSDEHKGFFFNKNVWHFKMASQAMQEPMTFQVNNQQSRHIYISICFGFNFTK